MNKATDARLHAEHLRDYRPEFMQMAAKISYDNIDRGGGPFGAVIVKDGKVIAT